MFHLWFTTPCKSLNYDDVNEAFERVTGDPLQYFGIDNPDELRQCINMGFFEFENNTLYVFLDD